MTNNSGEDLHYVNNKEFYEACRDYAILYDDFREGITDIEPKISEYIASCFIKICEKMANRYNFRLYTWKDEMIGDAILNCVVAIKSFKANDSRKNAFGYFSRVIYRAFTRRIKKENKAVKIRLDAGGLFEIHLGPEGYARHSFDTLIIKTKSKNDENEGEEENDSEN